MIEQALLQWHQSRLLRLEEVRLRLAHALAAAGMARLRGYRNPVAALRLHATLLCEGLTNGTQVSNALFGRHCI